MAAENGAAVTPTAAPAAGEKQATAYVVLQQVRVEMAGTAEAKKAASQAKDGASVQSVPRGPEGYGVAFDAWVPLVSNANGDLVIVDARTKDEALKTATAVPDEPERQRPGTFKAIPVRNWKGGITYEDERLVRSKSSAIED